MPKQPRLLLSLGFAALLVGIGTQPAAHAAGKIVCWKDAQGKVVGCGDTVPPEYRENATKELDSRGVTRKTTVSAEQEEKRREEEQARAKLKAAEEQRMAEQKRLDKTLLSTFTSPEEIDRKRDRDMQTIDLQIKQLEALLSGVAARHGDLKGRIAGLEKQNKPLPPALKTDYQRVTEEKERYEQSIASRRKEREDLQKQYADYKARYVELRGGAASAPAKK
jgi:chromosome segregation ATPase